MSIDADGTGRRRDEEQVLADRLTTLWSSGPDDAAAARIRAAAMATFRVSRRRAGVGAGRRVRLAIAAAAVMVLVSTAGGLWLGSQQTLPGDTLYPVKTAAEQVPLWFATGPDAEAKVYLDLADARIADAVRAGTGGAYHVLPELSGRYADAVARYEGRAAQAGRRDLDTMRLSTRAEREFRTHHEVLTGLVQAAPAAAAPGLQRALEASAGARARVPPGAGPPGGGPPDRPGPRATPGPTR